MYTVFAKINVWHVNIHHSFESLKRLGRMGACFQYNTCLRNLFKNQTTKQFELFSHRIWYLSYKRSEKSRGGVVLIFIKKKISYKIWKNLSESMNIMKYFPWKLCIKIPPMYFYKPPKGGNDILSMILKPVFKKSTAEKKLTS